MRPIRLTMTAFGPFAGTETVDFRAAMDEGLFGIYGPTGSGKSSIFNAITFALFGDSVKKGQSLRSDHADRSVMTKVTFVFELDAKRYVLHRTPEQSRPKVHGDGETKQTHEAYLFDATDILPDDITDDHCGKIIAEKKVSMVNDAVQGLLGYGATQFRQIVLLPQGDFELFLTSGTQERIKILRQLFDVSVYQQLEEQFKDAAAEANKAVGNARIGYTARLTAEGFESTDALATGITDAEAVLAEKQALEDDAKAALTSAKATLDAAQKLSAAFDAAALAKGKLVALEADKDRIDGLKTAIANARKAEALAEVEAQEVRAKNAVTTAIALVAQRSEQADASAKQSEDAAAGLTALQARAPEIDDLKQQAADIARHGKTLSDAKQQTSKLNTAKDAAKAAQGGLEAAKQDASATLAARDKTAADLDAARTSLIARAGLQDALNTATTALTSARAYDQKHAQLAAAKATLDAKTTQDARANQVQLDAKARLNRAEADLAHVQALHLAEKLVAGQPCPVCGAADHPKPASGQAEGVGLTDKFRQAKEAADTAVAAWIKAGQEAATAQSRYDDLLADVADLTAPERPSQDCLAKVEELQRQLKLFPDADDLAALEAKLADLKSKATTAEAALAGQQDIKQQADLTLALAQQALTDAIKTVPTDLQPDGAVELALKAAQDEITRRDTELRAADTLARQTREAALAAAKDLEAANTTRDTNKATYEQAQTAFASRLTAAGMTPETYATHKSGIAGIPTHEAAIASYADALAVARTQQAETAAAVVDQTPPDLQAFQLTHKAAQDACDLANTARSSAAHRRDQLQNLAKSIAAEVARIAALEAKTAPLRELAAQFNGQNEARLTLETFAIQAMFDQVLTSANLRLDPMSGGRYRLEIQDENMKGAAKRGLGIQVFDLWTGKARGTADISGGETFIAALALALGLSDVVENNAGSIRLDTIFIDEGFGSLDGEDGSGTLDQVLQTLTQTAGQTRAVGLISHVAMVKDAIPNGFQIEKTPRGSHVRVRGLG